MESSSLSVKCGKCGAVGEVEIPIRCDMEISLTAMRVAKCKACGAPAKHLCIGPSTGKKPK